METLQPRGVQLTRLDDFLARRASLVGWYADRLGQLAEVTLPAADDAVRRRSWFAYVIRLAPEIDRDAVIDALAANGIASKAYLPAIHLMPHLQEFGYRPGDYPVAESIAETALALPFYPGLTESQVGRVCESLLSALKR